MKKLSIFAMALAAMLFTSCGGNKGTQEAEQADTLKTFEQEQIEAKIKMELDSLASEVGKLKQLPFLQTGENGITLTEQEKQVKPEYLLDPAIADNAATLAEKYRVLTALQVDKEIAKLYEMSVDDYDKAITKLLADINDPSFKAIEDSNTLFETSTTLYDAMEQNGRINYFWQIGAAALVEQLYDAMNENNRINYFWQMAGASLVEEIYVMTENSDKFLSAFDDESTENITYRVVLLTDAINRLAEYDSELAPVVDAVSALEPLNAISVDELKAQLAEAKEKITEARNNLIK